MILPLAANIAAALTFFQAGEATWKNLRRDPERVARESRKAQDHFERTFRRTLPSSRSFDHRCEVKVGRFCYWYDGADTTIPTEPEHLRERRQEFLASLELARAEVPNSDWILGQRVRYLIEGNLADSALSDARTCGATRWWCFALEGWAHHTAARFAQAEIAFDSALSQMPEGLRCLWGDWSKVLDGPVYQRFRKLSCRDRERFMDSLFHLGDPLWTLDGNDLRTEMLSRRVLAAVLSVSRNPFPNAWGDDLEEMLLRYGWFTGWSEAPLAYSGSADRYVLGHGRSPAFDFFPGRTKNGPLFWKNWDEEVEVRTRYGPKYLRRATTFTTLQIARFPRGDSTLIAGAGSAQFPKADDDHPIILGLAAGNGPGKPINTMTISSAKVGAGLLLPAVRPTAVSLEAWSSDSTTAACHRVVVDELAERRISEVLFFHPGEELPENLERAVDRMTATTAFSRRSPVGIFWELGKPITDSARIEVTIARTDRGALRKLGERLRLAKKSEITMIAWTVRGKRDGVSPYATEVNFAQLAPGPYILSITMTIDGTKLETNRAFEITNR